MKPCDEKGGMKRVTITSLKMAAAGGKGKIRYDRV
jgi:hypothetical protein